MAISKRVIKHLEEAKYKYELVEHKTTYTAYDTARTTAKIDKKLKPEQITKTLVVKADNNYLLALVPANRKLDKKKLLRTYNTFSKKNGQKPAKKLDLAKEAWMKKNIMGKVGATPPFRDLLKLDLFIDDTLAKQKNLYVGSGEYEYSIKITTSQFLKNETPIKGNISAKA